MLTRSEDNEEEDDDDDFKLPKSMQHGRGKVSLQQSPLQVSKKSNSLNQKKHEQATKLRPIIRIADDDEL